MEQDLHFLQKLRYNQLNFVELNKKIIQICDLGRLMAISLLYWLNMNWAA